MTDDKDAEIEKLKKENKELRERLNLYIEGPKNPFADPEFARTHTYAGGGAFPRIKKDE